MNDDFQRYFPLEETLDRHSLSVVLYTSMPDTSHLILERLKVEHAHLQSLLLAWIQHHDLWAVHGFQFPPEQDAWTLDWILCDDPTIQALNVMYRGKDSPTDVLSFPTFENASLGDDHAEEDPEMPIQSGIPESLKKALTQHGGTLGTVIVSLDYAETHRGEEAFFDYVLERLIHGTLHVLGFHHATQLDYERVLSLQSDFKTRFKEAFL